MRLNSDTANKLVKQLTKARGTLLHQESQVDTYSYLQGEDPFKPDYDQSCLPQAHGFIRGLGKP